MVLFGIYLCFNISCAKSVAGPQELLLGY